MSDGEGILKRLSRVETISAHDNRSPVTKGSTVVKPENQSVNERATSAKQVAEAKRANSDPAAAFSADESVVFVDAPQGLEAPFWSTFSVSVGGSQASRKSNDPQPQSGDPLLDSPTTKPASRRPSAQVDATGKTTGKTARSSKPVKVEGKLDVPSMRIDAGVENPDETGDQAVRDEAIANENLTPVANEKNSADPVGSAVDSEANADSSLETSPDVSQHQASPSQASPSQASPSQASPSQASPSQASQHQASQYPLDWIPQWELKLFEIPSSVETLFLESGLIDDLRKRLSDAAKGGLKSMMVASERHGEGRSTVAIGMALAAAAGGLDVALLDADVTNPTLVEHLRLDLEYGWSDTIRSGLPISEVAVKAVDDGITLIPLIPSAVKNAQVDPVEAVAMIERMTKRFDLVIVDGPAAVDPMLYRLAPTIDSVVLVRDVASTPPDAINALAYRLREFGVQGIGVVENFIA